MMVMIVVQNIVIFNVFAKYGTDGDITFFTAVNRLYILLNTPLWGLMRALQPVAGMNYGAGKYKRTILSYRLFSLTGLCILIPFWIFIMFFPADVLSVMLPSVKLTTIQLTDFRIYMSVLLALPFTFMALVWFPSIENAKPATQISLLRQVVFISRFYLLFRVSSGFEASMSLVQGSTGWYFYNSFAVYKSSKRLKMNLRAA